MAKFCGNCGAALEENDRHCPNCGANVAEYQSPTANSTSAKTEGAGKKVLDKVKKINKMLVLKIVAIVLAAVIIVCAGLCTLAYLDIIEIPYLNDTMKSLFPQKNEQTVSSDSTSSDGTASDTASKEDNSSNYDGPYKTDPLDAEEYLKSYAQILSKESVGSSQTVQSESDVFKFLADRGFANCEIMTSFSIDGEYSDEAEISHYSTELHPIYTAMYTSASGDVWMLSVTNGLITAEPSLYNLQHLDKAPLCFAETDYIFSYDNASNTFFKVVPNGNAINVKKIAKIDAAALDALTEEGIDKL